MIFILRYARWTYVIILRLLQGSNHWAGTEKHWLYFEWRYCWKKAHNYKSEHYMSRLFLIAESLRQPVKILWPISKWNGWQHLITRKHFFSPFNFLCNCLPHVYSILVALKQVILCGAIFSRHFHLIQCEKEKMNGGDDSADYKTIIHSVSSKRIQAIVPVSS